MIDQNGNVGTVEPDRVDAAQAAGLRPAVKMVGPKGEQGYVAQDRVPAARQSSFQVAPDSGVRMATPDGQITYALPSEVEQFKKSGHVPIDDNGNFRVDPIEGEDNTDTMARAAKIAKNLPPDVMKKAIEAEKSTLTPGRVAATLGAAATLGVVGPAAIVGAAEAGGASLLPAARTLGTATGIAVKAARTPVGQYLIKRAANVLELGAAYKLGKLWMDSK